MAVPSSSKSTRRDDCITISVSNSTATKLAVTRGPSLVPGEKRLAVQVEDHPLAYNKFEGTIPQGEYGGGTVMIWNRGHWQPENDPHKGLAKGHLAFTLEGEKAQRRLAPAIR